MNQEPSIEIRDGVAWVPFSADDLLWLIDQYSLRDDYRRELFEAWKKLQPEDSGE